MYSRNHRSNCVEAALAEANAIEQAAEEDTDDEEAERDAGGHDDDEEEETNWCQNPFCQSVMRNLYASYCEDRSMCQRHRTLSLQCMANAEVAALQDVISLGRTDSFLVVGANTRNQDMRSVTGKRATGGQSEEEEAAQANTPFVIPRRKCPRPVSSAVASNTNSDSRLADSSKRRRAVTVGATRTANRKRPRLGPRMHFDEVLAQFKPRTATVPAQEVSVQITARRMQQSSRRTQASRHPGMLPTPLHDAAISAGGSHYAQSGYRSPVRELNRIPRSQAPVNIQASSEQLVTPQRCIRPKRVRGEVSSDAESPRSFYKSDERFRPHRPQFDSDDNWVSYRDIHDFDDRSYQIHQTSRRGGPTPMTSSSLPFPGQASANNNEGVLVARQPDQQHVVSVERPRAVAPHPTRTMMPRRFTPDIEMDNAERSVSSASFSFHEPFLHQLLSKFIQCLPDQLAPVMNLTEMPRKMRWYIDYTRKIEHSCEPYVHIQVQSTRIVVMVQKRIWLKIKGPSTVTLYQRAITRMRNEALWWRKLKSEIEECLEDDPKRVGDNLDLSRVFLRAWNSLKKRARNVSFPQQSNYFCGARLHHWNFVAGKVEIGSGSHEEKREAFRLAAASAASFLLQVDDGQNDRRWRPIRRASNSSETSDECKFLFVRYPCNESAVNAATATAIVLSDDSPNSTAEASTKGVVTPTNTHQSEQEEKVTAELASSGHVDGPIIVDSPSGTEDEGLCDVEADRSTVGVPAPSGSSAIDAPTESPSTNPVAARQHCNMCEIIRMRKPGSVGCRQYQLATTINRNAATSSSEGVETRAPATNIIPTSSSMESTSADAETEETDKSRRRK